MDCTVKQHFNLVLPTTTVHPQPHPQAHQHRQTYSHSSRTTTSTAATRSTGASTSTTRTRTTLSSSSSQGTASAPATINYLPSFRNSCKNVPTRTATATTATLIAHTAAKAANGSSSGGVVSSCCCHRWEHENYNYYKQHAMTPSMMATTTTNRIPTASRQQLPQQLAKQQEQDKFSLSHKSYTENNKNMKNYIKNIKTNYNCDDRGVGSHRLQKSQQQRYNDLLPDAYQSSTAPNSNTTTTTTTTTNAITKNKINLNKSITLLGKKATTNNNSSIIAKAAASASASTTTLTNSNSNLNSISMSTTSDEMTQLKSDLTVGSAEDILCCCKYNYAARKFIKSCKTNFNLRAATKLAETEGAEDAGEEEAAYSIRQNNHNNNSCTSSGNSRLFPVELIDQRAKSKLEVVGEMTTTNQGRRIHAVTKKCNKLQTTTKTTNANSRRQLAISNTTNTTTTTEAPAAIRCCSKNSARVSTDSHCDKVTKGSDFGCGNGSDSDGSTSSRSCAIMCNKNFTTTTNECDAAAYSELHRLATGTTAPATTTTFHRTFAAILHYLCYFSLWLLELCRRSLLHQMMQTISAVCSNMQVVSKLSFATTRKWLLCVLVMMLATSGDCWTGRQDMPTNCTFPARWEGSWFLSGYQQSIHIKGSQFSYRGKCAASDGNKYLIVDEKGCHRCLVIYEKHKNVLQYKESECEGDSIYMHQSNPSALAMRSVLNKQTEHRGGAHPNINGHSRLSSSDQYIMRSNDDMNDCPPDFCKGRETLQNLCDQIPGDALLYSLFRESAEPVKCPLKGPFVFTYNRGHGECKSPVSNIESCTEESRLLLSFQACPDVQGTESTVEELTCLATWKDGNSRYLVGLVSHHHAISNEERYRCFVYEKISPLMGVPTMAISTKDAEYKLAQSGDATCNGLDSAEVGSRIMSLRKPPLAERCDFPVWFKGPRHWHGLMGNSVYNYHSNDGSIHIIKPNGYMETRALCEQINKQTSTEMMAVVHYTTGCQSGFMCMMFFRRDTHVIEIQTGRQAARLEDACAPDYFDIHKMPYITLLASNPEQQICPMEGLYNLRGAIGPPYMTTRHKRNHNNKMHGIHGHHHQLNEEAFAGLNHKRHTTLSFRNGDKTLDRSSWHANTRGLPVRSRRNTPTSAERQHASGTTEMLLKETNANETAIDLVLRNRRNVVPGCITNVKAQRQLWIGCTDPDIIDVRPLCNDEGEEEYSCHGSWSENGTVHIIARHKSTKHGVCISYRPTEGKSAKLYIGDTCYRGAQKVPDHILEASLSVYGKCGETHVSSGAMRTPSWFAIASVLSVTVLLRQIQANAAVTIHR